MQPALVLSRRLCLSFQCAGHTRTEPKASHTHCLNPHCSPVESDYSHFAREELEVQITRYVFIKGTTYIRLCASTLHVLSSVLHVVSNPDGILVSGYSYPHFGDEETKAHGG